MGTPGERLKEARIAAGYGSAREGAERAGVTKDTYAQHENGTRGISKAKAAVYASAFGTTPEWLLYGKARPRRRTTVPLVGFVGAGAEAHYYEPADLGEVEAPDGSTEKTVAAEIKGTSLGPLFESWLIFYDDVRSPVTPDLYGRLCIVGLLDGKVLVKKIRNAGNGLYHLESNTEPTMFDQEVAWAARVKSMTPR